MASAQVFRAPDPGTGSVGLTGGELYGFERVGRLLAGSPSPETVMAASCDFGQDDDITVLALTRLQGGFDWGCGAMAGLDFVMARPFAEGGEGWSARLLSLEEGEPELGGAHAAFQRERIGLRSGKKSIKIEPTSHSFPRE